MIRGDLIRRGLGGSGWFRIWGIIIGEGVVLMCLGEYRKILFCRGKGGIVLGRLLGSRVDISCKL